MAIASLSFDRAPPLSVPLRFFLTAPLFGAAPGVLLLCWPHGMPVTRYAPELLAATHLFTLGFITMSMVGALLQILPVVAGSASPKYCASGGCVHVPLVIGTVSLAAAFLLGRPFLFELAGCLLVAAFGVFLLMLGHALKTARAHNATVNAIGFAGGALTLTVMAGVALALGLAGVWSGPRWALVDVHAGWGLAGWVAALVMGVAWVVVPMFQLTPPYPRVVTRWAMPLLLLSLVLGSAGVRLGTPALTAVGVVGVGGTLILFAGVTLSLQARRRRRVRDVTLDFWRLGLACLIVVAAAIGGSTVLKPACGARATVLLGFLFIDGFAVSVIDGMLYKIVPFLIWLHAQQVQAGGARPVGNMKEIISNRAAYTHLGVQALSLVLVPAALFWPAMRAPAAAASIASFAVLGANMGRAAWVHRRLLVTRGGAEQDADCAMPR
ncbi:MAG: hypothetical protein M0037_15670 [Betaproteobacteria bacterium]|nr:hypothetical protein [Betaproteobacteria bacterium]